MLFKNLFVYNGLIRAFIATVYYKNLGNKSFYIFPYLLCLLLWFFPSFASACRKSGDGKIDGVDRGLKSGGGVSEALITEAEP